jgi:Uri superfamily endonuclease
MMADIDPPAGSKIPAPRVPHAGVRPPISYQLHIQAARPVRVRVGRLGEFLFPAGAYVYTGSARRKPEARIARHLRKEKALRWHIDWLLTAPGVAVARVERSVESECALNRKVGGTVPVPGFGASDCRNGCGSHLRYLGPGRERAKKPA